MDAAEKILESEEYFYCEKMHCRLKMSVCVERQAEQKRRTEDPGKPGKFESTWVYKHCEDCEQGTENRRQMAEDGGQTTETGKRGDGEPEDKEMVKTCKVEGCEKKAAAQGFCGGHYSSWRQGNKILAQQFGEYKIKRPKVSVARKKRIPVPPAKITYRDEVEIIDVTILTVPVGNYPEIMGNLEVAAHAHIRAVEHQALMYILEGLKKDGYGNDADRSD